MKGPNPTGNPTFGQQFGNHSNKKGPGHKHGIAAKLTKIASCNKHFGKTNQGGPSNYRKNLVKTLMEEAHEINPEWKVDLHNHNLFISWIRSHNKQELAEVVRIEQLITLMEVDLANRASQKLADAQPLSVADLNVLKMVKDSLVELHKLKHGETRININAKTDFKTIRDLVFEPAPKIVQAEVIKEKEVIKKEEDEEVEVEIKKEEDEEDDEDQKEEEKVVKKGGV